MDYRAKVSLIGDERTGKTSLILRYLKNKFTNEYITTLGADFVDKTYTHDNLEELQPGDEFTVTIWDMAGQAHFVDIAKIYCEGSAGIIIVFDQNDPDSFSTVPKWIKFTQEVSPDAVVMIVSNKADLENEVQSSEIEKLSKKTGISIHYTSAKAELKDEISNVNDVFELIAKKILKNHLNEKKN